MAYDREKNFKVIKAFYIGREELPIGTEFYGKDLSYDDFKTVLEFGWIEPVETPVDNSSEEDSEDEEELDG